MKRSLSILIALILCIVLCSCKSKEATAADDMILSIGEITLDSDKIITEAENAVAALDEKDYKQLEYLENLKKARITYDDLVDQEIANHIMESINEIKDNITIYSRKKIRTTREDYDSCPDSAKKYINNYNDLVEAESKESALMVEYVINEIAAIGPITTNSELSISYVQKLFYSLSADEQSKVTNAETLTNAIETLRKLKKTQSEQQPTIAEFTKPNPKADKKTIDINGKQTWQVYARLSEFHFTGSFHGSGYFGIKILDSNQDFFALVANEIGDYNVDKSVYGLTPDEMYYIQIECTEGSWSCSWSGTYGK